MILRWRPAGGIILTLAAAMILLLPTAPTVGQAADGPELTVHRLIKPKSMSDFIRRGERAVVSCDADYSKVIATGSTPIFRDFRSRVAARPRGIVRRRLREGVLSGGFSFKIRFRAFARAG
jgi:hypothetical protein